jgi:acetyl-CoA carboxylase biotin carboxyl carrier protein
MDLSEVEKLILLMQRYELSELQVKFPEWEFCARKGEKAQPLLIPAPLPPPQAPPAHAPAPHAQREQPAEKKLKEITAPIVGTFYRAPAPDQPPFKQAGDRVEPADVVCIVEAMKVMNEIKAGLRGTIRKILVENATPVEFGQPLFQVELAE